MNETALRWGVVVLAAGKGTRMRSDLPKVLHHVAGRSLVDHVLDQALSFAQASAVTVVVGHQAERVARHVMPRGVHTVVQEPQLGTGHALQVALDDHTLDGCDAIVVLSGDVPGLRPSTLKGLRQMVEDGAEAALLTAILEEPGAYGRVVRDGEGQVLAVVEARDADAADLAIREVNAGVYAFRVAPVRRALRGLSTDNAQGEYYLTDVVAALRAEGKRVVPHVLSDPLEMQGVNSQAELAQLDRLLGAR